MFALVHLSYVVLPVWAREFVVFILVICLTPETLRKCLQGVSTSADIPHFWVLTVSEIGLLGKGGAWWHGTLVS